MVISTATRGISAAALFTFLLAHGLDVLFDSSNYKFPKRLGLMVFTFTLAFSFLCWSLPQGDTDAYWRYGRSLLMSLPCFFLAFMPVQRGAYEEEEEIVSGVVSEM